MSLKSCLMGAALIAAIIGAWRLAEVGAARPEVKPPIASSPSPPATAPIRREEAGTASSDSASPTSLPTAAEDAEQINARLTEVISADKSAKRQLNFAKLLDGVHSEAALKAMLQVFAQRFKDRKRDPEWRLFWEELVGRDPALAARLAETYAEDDTDAHAGGAYTLVSEWSKKDPQAAMRWLASRKELSDEHLDEVTLGLLEGYTVNDPDAAIRYALSIMPKGDKLWGTASWVITDAIVSAHGPQGLQSWYDRLPDDAAKKRLFYGVSNRLHYVSLEGQVAWLTSQATNPLRDDRSYRETAQSWAEEDPTAAMNWVFSLPPSPADGGHVGVGYAAFPWLTKDLAGFSNFYNQLAPALQQEVVNVVKIVVGDPKTPTAKVQAGNAFLNSLK